MCSFVCNIVYGSFACVCDRQFALRKNNGSISAVTQQAAVANSSVSFGVFRWRCVLFEKLKFCRWFAVGLPWKRNPPLVFAVLGATSISEHAFSFVATDNPDNSSRILRSNCLIVLTDNPVRQQSYSSQ